MHTGPVARDALHPFRKEGMDDDAAGIGVGVFQDVCLFKAQLCREVARAAFGEDAACPRSREAWRGPVLEFLFIPGDQVLVRLLVIFFHVFFNGWSIGEWWTWACVEQTVHEGTVGWDASMQQLDTHACALTCVFRGRHGAFHTCFLKDLTYICTENNPQTKQLKIWMNIRDMCSIGMAGVKRPGAVHVPPAKRPRVVQARLCKFGFIYSGLEEDEGLVFEEVDPLVLDTHLKSWWAKVMRDCMNIYVNPTKKLNMGEKAECVIKSMFQYLYLHQEDERVTAALRVIFKDLVFDTWVFADVTTNNKHKKETSSKTKPDLVIHAMTTSGTEDVRSSVKCMMGGFPSIMTGVRRGGAVFQTGVLAPFLPALDRMIARENLKRAARGGKGQSIALKDIDFDADEKEALRQAVAHFAFMGGSAGEWPEDKTANAVLHVGNVYLLETWSLSYCPTKESRLAWVDAHWDVLCMEFRHKGLRKEHRYEIKKLRDDDVPWLVPRFVRFDADGKAVEGAHDMNLEMANPGWKYMDRTRGFGAPKAAWSIRMQQ